MFFSFKRLKKLVRLHKVGLVAIMEPLVDQIQVDSFKLKLGFDNVLSNVNSKVWLFWKAEMQCSVLVNEEQLLVVKCKHGDVNGDFIIAAVYAKCNRGDRRMLE